MSFNLATTQIATAAGVAAALLFVVYQRSNRKLHYPPGPAPLPVVGNLFDLPKEEQWKTYERWSHLYDSDVLHLSVLGTHLIIINTVEAAKTLLDRKSALYSDRPRLPMINDLIGLHWHFGFMPLGDAWRKARRTFNEVLNATSVTRLMPQVLKWNEKFLENLKNDPDHFLTHLQHMASGISLDAAFGLEVQPSGQPDPFIGAAKEAIDAMMKAGIYGSYLVDFLPFLRYLPTPLASFKKAAAHWRISVDIAGSVPFSLAKKAVQEKKAQPSITSLLLRDHPEDETAIAQASHAIFASGSAATVSALSTFFLAMTKNPGAQARAREEIDAVIRVKGRLPEIGDEGALPYVSAVIKEVLRWNPVVPLSFPHRLTENDTYKGYYLPAGAVVLPNAWAMLHDTSAYGADTDSFRPERFLTVEGKPNPEVRDPDAAFGFARRVCPGKYLNHLIVFTTIVRTLALFNITKAADENGVPVEPSGDYTMGMLRYPLPFECAIVPRTDAIEVVRD